MKKCKISMIFDFRINSGNELRAGVPASPTFTEYFLVMMKPDPGDLESIERIVRVTLA